MLSILPKHIADEMLQGIKNRANQQEVQQQQQFNTMYMYRHENVRSVAQNRPPSSTRGFQHLLMFVLRNIPGKLLLFCCVGLIFSNAVS